MSGMRAAECAELRGLIGPRAPQCMRSAAQFAAATHPPVAADVIPTQWLDDR